MIKCNIGIQTRLGSSRLPEKSIKKMNGKPIIEHLIDKVTKFKKIMDRKKSQYGIDVSIFLLFPYDEIDYWASYVHTYLLNNNIIVTGIAGSPDNVLDRYSKMQESSADYLVRLTGDCPILPDQLLTKMVITGVKHRLDYLSNVDPQHRTMPDGYDVELISGRAFKWLEDNIPDDKYHKEHVTTYLRDNFQKWMRVAIMSFPLDLSDLKFSVDTIDDFNIVNDKFCSKIKKEKLAQEKGWGIYEY